MAPAEGLFTEFARTYESRKETDLSLSEYLEACRKDPSLYATAAERFIEQPETVMRHGISLPLVRLAAEGPVLHLKAELALERHGLTSG